MTRGVPVLVTVAVAVMAEAHNWDGAHADAVELEAGRIARNLPMTTFSAGEFARLLHQARFNVAQRRKPDTNTIYLADSPLWE